MSVSSTASSAHATAARQTMEVLAASQDVFATFFEHARVGLALADLTGRFVRVNATYAELLGLPVEELIGVPLRDVLGGGSADSDSAGSDAGTRGGPDDGDDAGAEAADETRRLLAGETTSIVAEQELRPPGGLPRWVLHTAAAVPDPDGRTAWYAVSAHDITERRRAEQELRDLAAVLSEQAVRDPLTGLANRALLEERIRASLARDARTGGASGLLFLDLDGFKAVNDEYGHAAGDAVLCEVAARLSSLVRPSDTVARIGGDEFVVLVEAAQPDHLDRVVERIRDALAAPVPVTGVGLLPVGGSVGMAWARRGDADPGGLLRTADAEMYRAKRARHDTTPGDRRHEPANGSAHPSSGENA